MRDTVQHILELWKLKRLKNILFVLTPYWFLLLVITQKDQILDILSILQSKWSLITSYALLNYLNKHRYLYSCLQLDFFFKYLYIYSYQFFLFFVAEYFKWLKWDWNSISICYALGSIKPQKQNKQITATLKLFLLVPVFVSAVFCMCVTELNCKPRIDNRITVNPEWNLSPLPL